MNFRDYAKANNLKVDVKDYPLMEMVQESYRLGYRSKGNEDMSKLVESHLEFMKTNPTATEQLCENLSTLLELEKLGESAILSETAITKEKPRRGPVDPKRSAAMKKAWRNNRSKMEKSLKKFRKSSKGKSFYRALGKFNSRMNDSKEISLKESISLFKAGNSALTHLAVELEHNPEFQEAFKEASEILSADLLMLLECIQQGSTPEESLLESFCDFHNILSSDDEEE